MKSNNDRMLRRARLALIIFGVLALEIAVRSGGIDPLTISAPSEVVMRLFADARSEELWSAIGVTSSSIAISVVIALMVGSANGYIMYRNRLFQRAAEPMFVAFYSAPAMLLYPFVLVLINSGVATSIVMAVVIGSAPIAINVALGLRSIDPLWTKVALSLNADKSDLIKKVLVPAAVPTIVTGFRLGLTFSLTTVVALEFLTYSGGLGRLVSWRYFVFDTQGVYAAIVLVMVIAILLNAALTALEAQVRSRWA
jgi:NitT/TauT family transport system permease protein